MARVELPDRTPYVVVAFQECERMNTLTSEIRRSLKELDLGLKVRIRPFKLMSQIDIAKKSRIVIGCLAVLMTLSDLPPYVNGALSIESQ